MLPGIPVSIENMCALEARAFATGGTNKVTKLTLQRLVSDGVVKTIGFAFDDHAITIHADDAALLAQAIKDALDTSKRGERVADVPARVDEFEILVHGEHGPERETARGFKLGELLGVIFDESAFAIVHLPTGLTFARYATIPDALRCARVLLTAHTSSVVDLSFQDPDYLLSPEGAALSGLVNELRASSSVRVAPDAGGGA